MRVNCFRLFLPVVFSFLPHSNFAQESNIQKYQNIRYEYFNRDTLIKEGNHLAICIPGFTQHNNSAEFKMLKSFLKDSLAVKFSYLIMNPPQHGEDYTWFKKLYSWGENEVKDLLELTDYLKVWENHDEVHLLGFSIGAKIILKFSAESKNKQSIKSVVAVAAPFRAGEINMRLLGDFKKISEGLISSFHAFKRAGILRIPYMVFLGMSKALIINKASPAKEISAIKAPTLLIHGSDDWLIKSYHSVKLFDRAKDTAQFSLVVLNTGAHAEDMLSRDGQKVRSSFFQILEAWLDYVNVRRTPKNKIEFNRTFKTKLGVNTKIKDFLYDSDRISLMSSPTINEINTDIWMSAADYNHSLVTFNSMLKLNEDNFLRHFLTFGSIKTHGSILARLRVGLSFEQDEFNEISNLEAYFSLYRPFGSILWLRRLTFIQGVNCSSNRQIYSADLAFLVLDFQINYGKFVNNQNDWQLGFNFPLIGSASGSYYFGIGYSRFLSSISNQLFKNNLKAYLVIGPTIPIFNTRFRVRVQYEQNGISPNGERIWGAGLSLNFREK